VLIGGISFLVSRRVLAGQAEQLERLLPDLLQFTLAYYLVPQDASPSAQARR